MSSPKFCTQCGNPTKPGIKFCSNCGTEIEPSSTEKPSSQQVPETPIQKIISTRSRPLTPPPPPKKIDLTQEEAEEVLDSLVYTADAVTPWLYNDKIHMPGPDEVKTIEILIKVSEKILDIYPKYRSEEWLGYSVYQRTRKYLDDGDVDSILDAKKKDGI